MVAPAATADAAGVAVAGAVGATLTGWLLCGLLVLRPPGRAEGGLAGCSSREPAGEPAGDPAGEPTADVAGAPGDLAAAGDVESAGRGVALAAAARLGGVEEG